MRKLQAVREPVVLTTGRRVITSSPVCDLSRFYYFNTQGMRPEDESIGALIMASLLEDELYRKGQRYCNASGVFTQIDRASVDRSILDCEITVVSPTHTPETMVPGVSVTFYCDVQVALDRQRCFQLPDTPSSTIETVGSPCRIRLDLMARCVAPDLASWRHIDDTTQYLQILVRDLCTHAVPRKITQRGIVDFFFERHDKAPLELRNGSSPLPGLVDHLAPNQVQDLKGMVLSEASPFCRRWWDVLGAQPIAGPMWYSTLLNAVAYGEVPPVNVHVSGGILASMSGCGKTRTCITLAHQFPGPTATVVMTRALCLTVWKDELAEYATHHPDFRYVIYHGQDRGDLNSFRGMVHANHLVLTVYDTVLCDPDIDGFTLDRTAVMFHRVIFDEAHTIKTPHVVAIQQHFPSRLRWAVSACPIGRAPHYRVALNILKCLDVLPDSRHPLYGDLELRPVLLERAGDRLFPFRLFCLLSYLTVNTCVDRVDISTTTIFTDLELDPGSQTKYNTQKHRLLHARMSAREFEHGFTALCKALSDGQGEHTSAFPVLTVPVGESPPEPPDDVCAICLNEFVSPTLLPCGNNHFLCATCAVDLCATQDHRCHICRTPFTPQDLRLLHPQPEVVQSSVPCKLRDLERLIRDGAPEKYLVVTRFTSAAQMIANHLSRTTTCYCITGSNHARVTQKFRTTEQPAILVGTLEYLKTGTNFSSLSSRPCHRLILFEPPQDTDDVDLVTARLANLSTPPNTVVNLIQAVYAGTVEEGMYNFHCGAADPLLHGIDPGHSCIQQSMVIRRLLERTQWVPAMV